MASGVDFDCRFDQFVSSSVETGEGAKLFEADSQDFGFLFLDVDRATRTGIMRGNACRSNVTLVESWHGDMTFIEATPAGNVTVTTIVSLPSSANPRERYAVHSRHVGIGMGQAMFSQNPGYCTEWPE